ncbi:MAG: carboxypeptidase regulatory-like domain-containing protein [Deltaproteobacteria bacterium]|nr:carboxypeptidase regulatory-like domain-containing protein [Deltaproteobacteria bacterium]
MGSPLLVLGLAVVLLACGVPATALAAADDAPADSADAKRSCAAHFVQAQKLKNESRLREARDHALDCAGRDCPTKVAEIAEKCAKLLQEINAELPSVVITVRDETGNDIPGVRVTVDGVAAPTGRPIDLDPGKHTVRVEHEGSRPMERVLEAVPGEQRRKVSFETRSSSITPASPPPSHDGETAPPAEPRSVATQDAADGGGQRVVAYVLGAAGLVGLGIGTGFLVDHFSKNSEIDDVCQDDRVKCVNDQTTRQAQDIERSAERSGNVAIGSFVAGGAALVAGIVLYATAPSARQDSVAAGFAVVGSPNGVLLKTRW